MILDREARGKLVRALAATMIEHAEELTSLDQAIGDGDHGLNMKRGFEAVLATLPGLADKSLPEMLKAIGMTLVMKVGGASGPLYGTFFTTLGKELSAVPSHDEVVRGVGEAIAAVKKIGRSDVGQKTMLDVLSPVHAELATGGPGLHDRLQRRAGRHRLRLLESSLEIEAAPPAGSDRSYG